MSTDVKIKDLLRRADRTPWGPQERAWIAEAIALAVDAGDEDLEYQARMRQTSSANMAGDTDLMLTSFAWCLTKHDADPIRFPAEIADVAADLLWQFKWMAGSLRGSPAFSSEQIAAVLDDMEAHYTRAGLGLSGVLTARFEDAWSAGRLDDAESLRVRLQATPRDSHSHCEACVRSQVAGYLATTDRDAESIALVEEMIDGGFTCAEEPEHALGRVLLPFLRAGRFEDARSAHVRSYRLAKDDPDSLAIVAKNIEFLALTGNESRALTLIERHIAWLAHDRLNADAHVDALSAIGLALDVVTAAGHGQTPVRGADAAGLVRFFGEHDGAWTAADLAAAAWTAAESIGDAFDARNGTTAFRDRLATMRERTEHWDVPVRQDVHAPTVITTTPADADARFTRAIDLVEWNIGDATLDAITAALADDPDAARRAYLLTRRVGVLFARDEVDRAAELLPEVIAALRAAGDDVQADVEERIGLAMYGAHGEADVAGLERELAASDAYPGGVRGDIQLTLAAARMHDGRFEEALALAETAMESLIAVGDVRRATSTMYLAANVLAALDDTKAALVVLGQLIGFDGVSRGRAARALEMRAHLRAKEGAFRTAAQDAMEAAEGAAAIGATDDVAGVYTLSASLCEQAGDRDTALARYRYAVQHERMRGRIPTAIMYRYGLALVASEHTDEAVHVLTEVCTVEGERGEDAESRAMSYSALARAFESAGRAGEAVDAWEAAANLYRTAGDDLGRGSMLTHRGRLLLGMEALTPARDSLAEAVEIARKLPETPGLAIDALGLYGRVLVAENDESGFAQFDEATAVAQAAELPWAVADIADARARALGQFGRQQEAVAEALRAADGYASAGDFTSAGGSELYAARVLAADGRAADAVPVYRAVLDRTHEYPPLRQIAALELGDVLENLGRHGEAAEARALIQD